MVLRILLASSFAAVSLLAQGSGAFLPGAIYAVHSATRRQPLTPESGLAPGSLCDINTRGLYEPNGELPQGEAVTLRFRAPGAANASDLAILAAQPSAVDF